VTAPVIAAAGVAPDTPLPEKFPEARVDVQLGKGSASLQASDVAVLDYGNIPNALFGGGPPPTSGTVSFKVVWNGVNERLNIKNTDPV
jgi:hypothetical protein